TNLTYNGYWWSSSVSSGANAWSRYLYNGGSINRSDDFRHSASRFAAAGIRVVCRGIRPFDHCPRP
ncbi:MAG: hypothetical protein ACKOBI_12270, partial [Bacteroidota bacterium]